MMQLVQRYEKLKEIYMSDKQKKSEFQINEKNKFRIRQGIISFKNYVESLEEYLIEEYGTDDEPKKAKSERSFPKITGETKKERQMARQFFNFNVGKYGFKEYQEYLKNPENFNDNEKEIMKRLIEKYETLINNYMTDRQKNNENR